MIPLFIKRFFGFGTVCSQALSDATTLCNDIASQQEVSAARRKQRLTDEQAKLASEARSSLDIQALAAAFRERRVPAVSLVINAEIKQLKRSLKLLDRALATDLEKAQAELTAAVAEANRQHKTEVLTADANLKQATAGLLAIEQQVRREAEKLHDQMIKASQARETAEITRLNQRRTQSIEQAAGATTERKQLLNVRLSELNQELAAKDLDLLYDRIELDLLSLCKTSPTDQLGMPLLALFTLEQNTCVLSCEAEKSYQSHDSNFSFKFSPPLFGSFIEKQVEPLRRFTASATQQQRNFRDYYSSARLTATCTAEFAGVISQDVRARIQKAQRLFDQVYIIAEAPDWQPSLVQKHSQVPSGDKVVIGERNGLFWLVCFFGTSPAEEYARREFGNQA
jgi:hypothetical protein